MSDELTGPPEIIEPLSGRLRAAFQEAVESADHLENMDKAEVELGYRQAEIIDAAVDSGDTKAIQNLSFGPITSMERILGSLGLNPVGRQKLGLEFEDTDEGW